MRRVHLTSATALSAAGRRGMSWSCAAGAAAATLTSTAPLNLPALLPLTLTLTLPMSSSQLLQRCHGAGAGGQQQQGQQRRPWCWARSGDAEDPALTTAAVAAALAFQWQGSSGTARNWAHEYPLPVWPTYHIWAAAGRAAAGQPAQLPAHTEAARPFCVQSRSAGQGCWTTTTGNCTPGGAACRHCAAVRAG